MTTKEKLAAMLEESSREFISGNVIAESLGITRSAVWKNIRLLEGEGYEIEAVTNKGYRLSDTNDVISIECLKKYLGEYDYPFEAVSATTSTNQVMRERADSLPDWFTLIAGYQSEGRGRSGRSFYSPAGTGLYISIIQRPEIPAQEAVRITTAAAVAACRAIEECTGEDPKIKWVNDVFVRGRKVCGILTEASFNMENGELDWAIMGIGFNVYEPEGGFPADIAKVAGAIAERKQKDLRCRLAASFIKHFHNISEDLKTAEFYKEYRERSFIIGHSVNVMKAEGPVPAVAVDIDNECRLKVRYENGKEELLSSGEVSIRPL